MKRKEFIKMAGLAGTTLLVSGSCTENQAEQEINDKADQIKKAKENTDRLGTDAYTKDVGGPIDPQVATEWITSYRKTYKTENAFVLSKEDLRKLLEKEDAEGLLMQLGYDEDYSKHMIVGRVTRDGKVKTDIQFESEGERDESV